MWVVWDVETYSSISSDVVGGSTLDSSSSLNSCGSSGIHDVE